MYESVEDTIYLSHIQRNNKATTKTNWFNEWNAKAKRQYQGELFRTQRKIIDNIEKSTVSRIV
jgi:hypothetical protein